MKNLTRAIKRTKQIFISKITNIAEKQTNFVLHDDSKPKKKEIKSLKLSKAIYPELDKFFFRFVNSRPVEGRVSGKSLAFVVGAQNIGKSEYIQKNVSEIKKQKKQMQSNFNEFALSLNQNKKFPQFNAIKSPEYLQNQIKQVIFSNPYCILLKKNYKFMKGLNYKNFIQDLHDEIFQQITTLLINFQQSQSKKSSTKSLSTSQSTTTSLLTSSLIKQILIKQHSPQYLFMYIKDVVFAILQDKDTIYFNHIQFKSKLDIWNDENLKGGQTTWEHFFEKQYQQLIQIIWQAKKDLYCDKRLNQQNQKAQIALQLFYSVFKRIQYQNRPEQYLYSWYQSGIQSTNFVFDILNFLSGTGKYLKSIQKQYISSSATKEQRQDIKQFLEKSNNFILQGNHIDVAIILMNLQELACFKNRSKQFLDFFDHIICRTVSESNFRDHFPMIIEIPNRAFLDETLQLGKIQGSNPVIVEIPGYIQHYLRLSNLIQIFELEKVQKLFNKLGRNQHTWRKAIQNMAKGVLLDDILDGSAQYQQLQCKIAQAKMNRVYTYQKCLPYLNSQDLDMYIRYTLTLFSRVNGMSQSSNTFFGTNLFKTPYFEAMLHQNIFYHMYYLAYVDYSSNLPAYYNYYKKTYLKQQKQKSSWLWLRYLIWKRINIEYPIRKREFKYSKNLEKAFYDHNIYQKRHVDIQFSSTYYGPINQYQRLHHQRTYYLHII